MPCLTYLEEFSRRFKQMKKESTLDSAWLTRNNRRRYNTCGMTTIALLRLDKLCFSNYDRKLRFLLPGDDLGHREGVKGE